jgi:hypothetical protein
LFEIHLVTFKATRGLDLFSEAATADIQKNQQSKKTPGKTWQKETSDAIGRLMRTLWILMDKAESCARSWLLKFVWRVYSNILGMPSRAF